MDKIRDYLSDIEKIAQLAEEVSELAQEVKCMLDEINSMIVAHEEVKSKLTEERGD